MVGALIYSVVCNLCDDKAPVLAMLSLVLGFVAYELEPKPGALTAFNWMPFYAQNEVRLTSFGNILAVSWPFLALGCVAVLISSPRTRMAVFGAFAVAVLVFALESAQLYIPGRYGDITTVLLAVGAWSLPWFLAREALAQPEEQPSNHAAEAFIASASTPVPHVICCDGQHAK
jgi:VanZ family protein